MFQKFLSSIPKRFGEGKNPKISTEGTAVDFEWQSHGG